jgi:two-component system response regulator HydG
LRESDASVLVVGESGSGKELVAKALHSTNQRYGSGPFVPVNCAAVPANLLESMLFGHVKGAFTDAKSSRAGLFVEANGGTLFLDEIGEMPLEMQSKLLRVLQERKVRPVGGAGQVEFDCRIVTATNKSLEEEIDAGNFREDLYYRINVVTVDVPPLRERGNDVLLLAQHFLEQAAVRTNKSVVGLSRPVARKLLDYDWPGNVRELRNAMERAVALTRREEIGLDDLPESILRRSRQPLPQSVEADIGSMLTIDELERKHIKRVLRVADGNKTQAARVLGIDRRTLYRKLERFAHGPPANA